MALTSSQIRSVGLEDVLHHNNTKNSRDTSSFKRVTAVFDVRFQNDQHHQKAFLTCHNPRSRCHHTVAFIPVRLTPGYRAPFNVPTQASSSMDAPVSFCSNM